VSVEGTAEEVEEKEIFYPHFVFQGLKPDAF
jgi:hypothetical protein